MWLRRCPFPVLHASSQQSTYEKMSIISVACDYTIYAAHTSPAQAIQVTIHHTAPQPCLGIPSNRSPFGANDGPITESRNCSLRPPRGR